MRTPFLKVLFDGIGATLTAVAFAEENEAGTARQILSGESVRRGRRVLSEIET